MKTFQGREGTICCFSDSIPDDLAKDLTKLVNNDMDPQVFNNRYGMEESVKKSILQGMSESDEDEDYDKEYDRYYDDEDDDNWFGF